MATVTVEPPDVVGPGVGLGDVGEAEVDEPPPPPQLTRNNAPSTGTAPLRRKMWDMSIKTSGTSKASRVPKTRR
jgi:hypothetical protein